MELNALSAFEGSQFKIEFTSEHITTPPMEPWNKSVETVTMFNVCPELTDTQTMFQLSLTLQGCSRMRLSVYRSLWLGIVKHIVKTFDFKSDQIFRD